MLSYSKEPQVLQRISVPVWPGVLVQGPQDVQELPQDGPAVAAARPEVRLRASELIESDAGVAVVLPDCARDCQVSCGKRVNFFFCSKFLHIKFSAILLRYTTTTYAVSVVRFSNLMHDFSMISSMASCICREQ